MLIMEPGRQYWLEDPETIWQIRNGSVDLYAVTSLDTPRYQQVFLISANPGQPLFSLSTASFTGKIRLMAMSSNGAELKVTTRSRLLDDAVLGGQQVFEAIWFMIEEWLEILLSSPALTAPPRLFSLLTCGETLTLGKGQSVRTSQAMVWARRLQGKLVYGRLPEFSVPDSMDLPIIKQGWLVATEESTISGLSTEDIFPAAKNSGEMSRFWQPLDNCHQLFTSLIEKHFADELLRSNIRLSERQNQRKRLLSSAIVHLLRNDLPDISALSAEPEGGSGLLVALRAIARHLEIDEEKVRMPKWGNHLQGSSLMRQIARLSGMHARKVILEPGWHKQDNGPILAYFGPNAEPVALLPLSPSRYGIFRPGEGIAYNLLEEDLASLHSEAYTFYVELSAKSANLTDWLKFAMKKCWADDFRIILIASLVAGIIPMLTPFVTNTIFSDLIPIGDRQGHVMVVQVMMVAALTNVGVSLTRGVAVIRVKGKSRLVGESALWLRMLSLPSAFFRQFESGDLALRLNSISSLSTTLSNSVVSAVFNSVLSVFSLIMMFYYSWKLGLAALGLLLVYIFIVTLLLRQMVDKKNAMMLASGKVAGQVLQILNGLNKFRMQGAETQAFYLWAEKFGTEWKHNRAIRWTANYLEVLGGLQPILLSMLLFGLTMLWLESGDKENTIFITQADFISFNSAFSGFNSAMMGMVSIMSQLLDVVPILNRLRPVLETEPEVGEDKMEASELTGQIEVSNVTFRYSPEKQPALQNVSLKIQPGQFVAIVGSSGSGKSTLLRLLLGFEKPDNGTIYFDNQDFAELNVTSVRSQMGVVLQHGQLMAGDIFSNIVGSLPLTVDDAWHAAEMVGLADDIRAMPMSMNTLISEGASNISGGQRQRILIAKSIVNHPRIIVFDEATSALDNRTQSIVAESLEKLKATRIIVAHRLSTICNADYIFVLDNGRIVESGTYDELMDKNGLFTSMAKRQLA